MKAATPKAKDLARLLVEVQRVYLEALIPYIIQACMLYLIPVYAQFQTNLVIVEILKVFVWPTFAADIIIAALTNKASSADTYKGIASKSYRALRKQSKCINSTNTIGLAGASEKAIFRAQQLGEKIAIKIVQDIIMKFDGIRKLLESGIYIAYNPDQILKEKLDLIRVGLDIFASTSTPSTRFQAGNTFISLVIKAMMAKIRRQSAVQFLLVTKQYLLTTVR